MKVSEVQPDAWRRLRKYYRRASNVSDFLFGPVRTPVKPQREADMVEDAHFGRFLAELAGTGMVLEPIQCAP